MNTERIHTYWSHFFGLEIEGLKGAGVTVVPHHYLDGYQGAWVFRHENRTIISLPPKRVKPITHKMEEMFNHSETIFSTSSLDYLFGTDIQKTIGPVYQGYYDNHETILQTVANVKKVDFKNHQELIDRLSISGDEEGWSHSGISEDKEGLYAYFCDDTIASMACYSIIRGGVAFIGVYTHPDFRRKEFSQEVLKKVVRDLSAEGKLIRYQTLVANQASVRLATKIGFIEYAVNMAIRLKG